MPSDAAKKRQAKKKSQAQARGKPKPTNSQSEATTGVLASHPESRDVHIENFSITFHGVELLSDTRLELNRGRRYGLLGLNGCGKLLEVLKYECWTTDMLKVTIYIVNIVSR